MFNYTVMRPAILDIGPGEPDAQPRELGTWEVWDVQANSAKEAVEAAADIPGSYVVFESDPIFYQMDNVTRLEIVEIDQADD